MKHFVTVHEEAPEPKDDRYMCVCGSTFAKTKGYIRMDPAWQQLATHLKLHNVSWWTKLRRWLHDRL